MLITMVLSVVRDVCFDVQKCYKLQEFLNSLKISSSYSIV